MEIKISSTFKESFISEQNKFRARHQAPPLKLSKSLSNDAQKWANEISTSGIVRHSNPKFPWIRKENTGENIFKWQAGLAGPMSETSETIQFPPNDPNTTKKFSGDYPPKVWYDNLKFLNFDSSDYEISTTFNVTGNLTQMLWKSSRKCGVGVAERDGVFVIVARYEPKGNEPGKYKDNVLRCK